MLFVVDGIETSCQFPEKLERGFAHQVQHLVRTVFRGDFKAAGHVVLDDGFQVFPVYGVDLFVARAMHGEVVPDTGTHETVFLPSVSTHLIVKVQKVRMVGV